MVQPLSSSLTSCALASIGASYALNNVSYPAVSFATTTNAPSEHVFFDDDYGRFYNQPFCYDNQTDNACVSTDGNEADVFAFLGRNSNVVCGTFLFDPGCQTHLMRSSFSKFMRNVRKSSLTISGFDNSTQSADNKGESSMYFMQTDRSVPLGSTDQGVENFVFDTVDDLQSNLFSVSDYYEEGADIHLTHNGFSGIEGTNPRTGKAFQIPCVYSYEHKAWLVHFVMAKSAANAEKHGKVLERHIRDSQNHLSSEFLTEDQLIAAVAINRGDVVIRDEDEYVDLSLGDWRDDDNEMILQSLSDTIDIPIEKLRNICKAYPTRSNRKYSANDEDNLAEPVPETPTKSDVSLDTNSAHDSADDNVCAPCSDPLIDDYYQQYDASFTGMKESLDRRHKRMDNLQLHMSMGCVGHHPDCPVCHGLKRNLTRRFKRCDPHKETRVGHTWGFDLIQCKTDSMFGNKYCFTMRDFKTGYFKLKFLRTKDQVAESVRACIQELRDDPRFKLSDECGYELVSEIRCDPAGEQRDDNTSFIRMCAEMRTRCIWGDPTDKRSDGFSEQAVKMIELTGKSIMASNATPIDWWEPCYAQAAEIRNHVPMTKNLVSGDGDAITPIEELSWGRVSRRMCCRYINHLVTCGTPCHVSQKPSATAGSDNTVVARHKPGIAFEMIGNMPAFKSPINGLIFRSKSYMTYDAPRGMSAYEFFGCDNPSPLPYLGLTNDGKKNPHLMVTFDDIGLYHLKALPSNFRKPRMRSKGNDTLPSVTVTDEIGYVYEVDESGEYRRTTGMIQKLEDAEIIEKSTNLSTREKHIALLKYDPKFFIHKTVYQPFNNVVYEGTVRYCDVDTKTRRIFWNVLYTDNRAGDLWDDEMIKWCIDHDAGTICGPQVTKTNHPSVPAIEDANASAAVRRPDSFQCIAAGTENSYIEVDGVRHLVDPSLCNELLAQHDCYYTSHDDTFKDVCKAVRLNPAQWPMYYSWVHECFMRGELFLKRDANHSFVYPEGIGFQYGKGVKHKPLPNDTPFPIPLGPLWQARLNEHAKRSDDANLEHLNVQLEHDAFHCAVSQAYYDTQAHRKDEDQGTIYANIARSCMVFVQALASTLDKIDHFAPPANYEQAMKRDDWDSWLYCTLSEIEGMEDMDVFSRDWYTLDDLRKMGIKTKPMPLGLIYDIKRDPTGQWDKDKARLVSQPSAECRRSRSKQQHGAGKQCTESASERHSSQTPHHSPT